MLKLIVWDLDDTLWNGTVYYTNKDSITLKKGAKQVLKEVTKLGLLNAICSKNNKKDAMQLLKKFELLKFFSAKRIDWGHKSDYIKELSEELRVPLNKILFIDDDAFQREEVSKLGVKTVFFNELINLLDYLKVGKKRINLINQQEDRISAEKNYKGNYKTFLKSCNLEMSVRIANKEELGRVVQLLNRTNELNATVNRKSLDEINKSNDLILVATLKDKFGDYGIMGEAIIQENSSQWFIKDFTISCRTMGRGTGKALLITIMNLAKKKGIKRITGYLKHTSDNWRMKPLYEKRGFVSKGIVKGKEFFEFIFDKKIPELPEWIHLNTRMIF